jgi:transcriptional regulator with XRE-family HTH domain
MKNNTIRPREASALQKAFAAPYEPDEEAEFKGLMFVEELLSLMKEQGINRTQLAKRMGVGSPRVTAMLNGSSNFTLETLVRAAQSVGATLEQVLVPAGCKGRWVIVREDEIHSEFKPRKKDTFARNASFELETDEIAPDDHADAA